MKTSKILAIISFLSGIVFVLIGSVGSKTYYYKSDLEGLVMKSFLFFPCILAIILGIIAFSLFIKAKEFSSFFILFMLLGIIVIGFLSVTHWAKSLSALRQSKLAEIRPMMEMYYDDEGQYPEIKVNNGFVQNEAIGDYSMPKNAVKYDRILNFTLIKYIPFKGISNSDSRDKYCIYASIWQGREEVFAVSQQGAKTLQKEPTSIDDCY